MKRVGFLIDEEKWDDFRTICECEDVTASQIIRGWIVNALVNTRNVCIINEAKEKKNKKRGEGKC